MMKNQQKLKTEYSIKIADLSDILKLNIDASSKKKINKILKTLANRQFSGDCRLYINMNIKEALCQNFKNLKEIRAKFKTNEDCKEFLEKYIWEGVPVHPKYPTYKVYQCKDGWYKCKENGAEFNILTGTFLKNTKVPLPIWFEVIFRVCSDRRGLATPTLMRDYGLSKVTAEMMIKKIDNAMGFENHQELEKTVEVDEYYEGGALKNMHKGRKLAVKQLPYQNKKLLQGFVQRNGNAVIRVIPNMFDGTLNAGVLRYVKPGSTLYSDDNPSYQKLPPVYIQGVVVHSKGNYVNKENKNIFTNTIESLWATFERMKKTHIHVSLKHLQNYANEVVFRYNTRKMEAGDACLWLLQNMQGTNITWKEIRNGEYTRYNRDKARVA